MAENRNLTNSKVGKTYIGFTDKVTITNIRMASRDIANWKRAIDSARSATTPNRKLLMELYADIILDGHLSSVMEKRFLGITNKQVRFVEKGKEGEENDMVRDEILETPWFYKLTRYLIEAKAYGHSLCELIPGAGGKIVDVQLVPRLNVSPEHEFIMQNAGQFTTGWSFNDPYFSRYLISYGGKINYGLLMTAAQYVIYKRGGFGDWAQFAELFGMPFRLGTYNPYDDSTRIKLEEAMENAGSAGWMVKPDGTAVEFIQSNGSGKSEVFQLLVETCNAELSKIFVGQTMTTENGSSRSQSEVHKEEQNELTLGDMVELEYFYNWVLVEKLRNLGYKIPEGRFTYKSIETMSLQERIKLDVELAKVVDIDPEYWYETYGIPAPGGVPSAKPKKTDPDLTKTEPPGKKNKPGVTAAASHPGECCHYRPLLITASADDFEITPEEEDLLKKVYDGYTSGADFGTMAAGNREISKGLSEGLPLTTGYGEPDHVAAIHMHSNIHHFGFDKSLAQVMQLNKILDNDKTYADFKREAIKVLDAFNRANLKTEYDLAVSTSQNAANWIRQKKERDLFPYLKYLTAGDNRVRESHAALDGKIFRVTDNTWLSIYPPNGWNCRCEMIQLRDPDGPVTTGTEAIGLLGDEYEKMKKAGFAYNRGDAGVIFDLSKTYAADLRGQKKKALSFDEWGLKPMADMKGLEKLKYSAEDPDALMKRFDSSRQKISGKETWLFQDALGRPVGISRGNLEQHITGKKYVSEKRSELFAEATRILKEPTEVYFTQVRGGKYEYSYLGMYKDGQIVKVVCELDPDLGLEIKTWYLVDEKKYNEKAIRNGILVFKKEE